MKLSNAELTDKIWSAFRRSSLEKIYVGDESSTSEEYAEAAKFFKTHTREELAENPTLIPLTWANWNFISAVAWHHYLPAYLIAGLNPNAKGVRETILLALAPTGHEQYLVDIFLDRVTQLTLSQRAAIESWYDAVLENYKNEVEQDSSFESSFGFWHDELGIRDLVESFEPDPNAWRTQFGSYPWMSQSQTQQQG